MPSCLLESALNPRGCSCVCPPSYLSVHRAVAQTLDVTGDLALRPNGTPRDDTTADADKGLKKVTLRM